MFLPIVLEAHNPGPMTGAGNNTYLLGGTDGTAVLIDAGVGHPEHLAALDRALASTGSRLAAVLVTHGHADHASGAPALGAAHPEAVFAKYPASDEEDPSAIEWRSLRDGEAIAIGDETLTVVHTPGHSPDHVAFWHDSSRSIFAGDLVVAGSSVMIHTSRGGNLAQYLASLEGVLALEPRQLFPAHGPRVDAPRELLTQYLEHRRMRERQVIKALAAGHTTVEAITNSIYDDLAPQLVVPARETVRAHLDKLQAEGIARERDSHWTL
jgi:glyoxylase-like metal-dependent hydrolase (beta-lactamase superfamily II)